MLIRNLAAAIAAITCLTVAAFAQTPPAPKASPSPTVTKKAGPARDPKTGKFIKKAPAVTGSKGGSAMGVKKAGPARDPKTGRFISTKKPGAMGTPSPAPKKP